MVVKQFQNTHLYYVFPDKEASKKPLAIVFCQQKSRRLLELLVFLPKDKGTVEYDEKGFLSEVSVKGNRIANELPEYIINFDQQTEVITGTRENLTLSPTIEGVIVQCQKIVETEIPKEQMWEITHA